MDWSRLELSLKSALDRARAWLVPLVHFCWMSAPVAMVAWGSHLAASLTVSIDFVAFRDWMRETGRSAWWAVPFFVIPAALVILANSAQSHTSGHATMLRLVAATFYFWGVAEISGLLRMAAGRATQAASPVPSRPT